VPAWRGAADIQANRIESAQQLCVRYHAHVALKGAGTVMCTPAPLRINTSEGLAGAGRSGDRLTGMVAALLGQGMATAMRWRPPSGCMQHCDGLISRCVFQIRREVFTHFAVLQRVSTVACRYPSLLAAVVADAVEGIGQHLLLFQQGGDASVSCSSPRHRAEMLDVMEMRGVRI